ncbi:MAG: ATP phosphoribosyltransferase regulatory subunit [Oscillospiraceae bacterium]|nr:ATP phosphoribosyltransferase regulatory subunit [Oscillospiraceae bacterium]
MKRYDLLTPEGTRDLLFDECIAKRMIEERLRNIFIGYGYSEVVTPGLEFYDVFNGKARYFPQENMYKLVDGKNRMMVLRPDSTMPIARLAATRLREEPLPLKLFYNQSIFMVNPKNSGRDDEFAQSGIEILGGESTAADYEALVLAVQALSACSEEFRLEIGESSIFRLLVSELGIDGDEADNIQALIDTKNYPALNEALSAYSGAAAEALRALPTLFGGEDVFVQAEKYMISDELKEKLFSLKTTYDALRSAGIDEIKVDLGLVHKKNYYTGIIFRGYVEGYGSPALSGGRYDNLIGDFGRDVPAVGFAVNVEAAAKVLLKSLGTDTTLTSPADVLVYAEKGCEVSGLMYCSKLIRSGVTVFNSVFAGEADAAAYAVSHGIKRMDIVTADGVTEKAL